MNFHNWNIEPTRDQADEEAKRLYCKEMQRGGGQGLGVSGIR